MLKRLIYLFSLLYSLCAFASGLDQAQEAYTVAEKAVSYEDREKGFNQALSNFLAHPSQHPNYLYNVGNCYYQLSKPGYAIWYYERALRGDPRNKKIKQNLKRARESALLASSKSPHIINTSLLPTSFLKIEEKKGVQILLASLVTLTLSALIWRRRKSLKWLSAFSLFIAAVFFASFSLEQGLKSKEGLVVESALLRCDAAKHYELVESKPLAAGSKVVLLELSEDQKWAKVKISSGKKGFIPIEKVRAL